MANTNFTVRIVSQYYFNIGVPIPITPLFSSSRASISYSLFVLLFFLFLLFVVEWI